MKLQKKISLVALFVLVLLVVLSFPKSTKASPLFQTTPSPSPTITTQPLIVFETPTPFEYSSDCPEDEIVEGWGTVTPSALWMSLCAHCILTPYHTYTPAPTDESFPTPPDGTVYPTQTPEPTPTSTPDPSPIDNFSFNSGSHGAPYVTVSSDTWTCSKTDDYTLSCAGTILGYDSNQYVSGDIFVEAFIETSGNEYDPVYWEWELFEGGSVNPLGMSDQSVLSTTGNFTARGTSPPTGASYVGNVSFSATLIISLQPIPDEPPPPELYCDEVQGETGEDVFGYTGITYGQIFCVDLLPFEAEFLGLTISIPHFAHICIQDVGIGTATILGMPINLNVALFVLGLGWAIRNLFIS